MDTRNLAKLARRAAELAGAHVRAASKRSLAIETKRSPVDLVTDVDRTCERIIVDVLTGGLPGSRVLGEEYGSGRGVGAQSPRADPGVASSVRWIIDPIDGTHNFVVGRTYYAVSIGVEVDGELVGGVVHDPATSTTYWADTDLAWIDDTPAQPVSRLPDFRGVNTSVPFQGYAPAPADVEPLVALLREHGPVRSPGSLALQIIDVAVGRTAAAVELRGAAPWDIAGAFAFARAAGCEVVQLAPPSSDAAEGFGHWGSDSYLVARNRALADHLAPRLRAILPDL